MSDIGEVINIDGKKMAVEFSRTSGCHSCGVCITGKDPGKMLLYADNDINAQIGDHVRLEMPPNLILKFSFIVYIFPLIVFIAALAAGSYFFKENNLYSGLFAVISLFISFAIVKIIDNRYKKKNMIKLTKTNS